MKRTTSERRVAEWMKGRKAVVGIMSKEMAVEVGRADKKVKETVIAEVDLYVVQVLVATGRAVDKDGGSSPDRYEKVIGSPDGGIYDAVCAAMRKYPLPERRPVNVKQPRGLAVEEPQEDEPV